MLANGGADEEAMALAEDAAATFRGWADAPADDLARAEALLAELRRRNPS